MSSPEPHQSYGHYSYNQPAYVDPTTYGVSPQAQIAEPIYASWFSRVGAALIDSIIASVPGMIVGGVLVATHVRGASDIAGNSGNFGGLTDSHWALALLGLLLTLAIRLWNEGHLQGTTGRSLGKRVLKIDVVDATHGGVLGSRRGMMRVLVDELLGLPTNILMIFGVLQLINYVWPWWDKRNQTWTDKVVKSVVVIRPARR